MIPKYGTVLIDFDGEALMSLGVMADNHAAYLQTVVLVEAPPSLWKCGEVRYLPVNLIGEQAIFGTRYVVQGDPS